jgi:hypothetical protein
VTGIVYRQLLASWSQFGAGPGIRPVSGVPLGGVDTGALYVEASGAFGYSSIFNHYTPQGGPLNTPYLGLGIGDKGLGTHQPANQKLRGRLPAESGPAHDFL